MSIERGGEKMQMAPADWAGKAGGDARSHPLYPLFYPRSVAVVGASPKGGYGLRALNALKSFGFAGSIYPINPNYDTIAGLKAYPKIGSVPEPVDAVAIAVPSQAVAEVVEQSINAGVKGGIVFGSGFAETGNEGHVLQADLRKLCGERFPLIGPNCLGVMSYLGSAALWCIPVVAPRTSGTVGLVTQSGNMGLTLMSSSPGMQLAHAVSVGNQAVVDAVDVMSFFLAESNIRVIAAVIEGLADVAKFRRVAMQAAQRDVPIIVLKLGRSEKGSQAAVAHTGSLTGSDQLYNALFCQHGVLRVDDLDELIETAKLLSSDPRPTGPRLGVFASSGGECGLISDIAAGSGVELPELPRETRDDLIDLLPSFASPHNPLDITASSWGNRDIYCNVAKLLSEIPEIDIVSCIGDATRNTKSLEATGWDRMIAGLADARATTDKPIVLINTISDVAYEMTEALGAHGIIHLTGASNAMRAIGHAGQYGRWRKEHRTEQLVSSINAERRASALELLPGAASGGVSETVSKQLLQLYDIPVPSGGLARDFDEALALTTEIGYPVALKVEADDIHHKTEIGGVALSICSDGELRAEFMSLLKRVSDHKPGARIRGVRVERMATGLVELIIGGRNDSLFGPIVVAGLGGVLAEALQDVSTRLAPIDEAEARTMLSELRGAALLGPYRGRPAVDVAAAVEVISRVSQLLNELPEIQELDLNPVLVGAYGEGCIAVDALVVM
jgi:acetate---CoA ligase (ADP-forming)